MIAGPGNQSATLLHERSDVLGHYEQALKEWRTYRMALEMDATGQRWAAPEPRRPFHREVRRPRAVEVVYGLA